MNSKESIERAYDKVADDYAASWWNEFEKKHFDRVLLKWLATQIPRQESVLEIGSGPGEVSGYLSCFGVKCIGTDLSRHMIENARKYFPQVQFEVQDFFQLKYPDQSFAAVVAYYAIVNWALPDVSRVLQEARRVLKPDGLFLFTFHIYEGEESTIVTNFLNYEGNELTFYFFKVEEVKALVEALGFQIVDILVRHPYPEVEYQSRRAYFILKNDTGPVIS